MSGGEIIEGMDLGVRGTRQCVCGGGGITVSYSMRTQQLLTGSSNSRHIATVSDVAHDRHCTLLLLVPNSGQCTGIYTSLV